MAHMFEHKKTLCIGETRDRKKVGWRNCVTMLLFLVLQSSPQCGNYQRNYLNVKWCAAFSGTQTTHNGLFCCCMYFGIVTCSSYRMPNTITGTFSFQMMSYVLFQRRGWNFFVSAFPSAYDAISSQNFELAIGKQHCRLAKNIGQVLANDETSVLRNRKV